MKVSRGTLALGLLLSVAIPSGAALASDPGEQILLARANYWRAQHRPDLASEFLNKLLAMNPSQPDALYQQAVLALEQGRNGDVQLYAARLRLLAPSDPRATELAAALARAAAPGQTVTAAAPAALAPARPVMSVQAAPPVPVAPVAVAALAQDPAPMPAVAASQPSRTELALVMASADSDDLTPAKPASPAAPKPGRSAPALALGEPPRFRQVAELPQATISDGDPSIPAGLATVRAAGSADLGFTARTVQVAQVELQPPPVINGYQRPTVSAYSPDDTLAMQIDRNLEFLEGQSNPTLVAGIGFRGHSGDDGFDRLNELGGSFEGSFSPWYTGTARIAVLPVWLDAGTVGSSKLGQFGANTILSAAGAGLVGSQDQTASGVGILGSYSYSDFSGQFGTSPLGFPVVNLIGDAAYTPKFLDNTLSVRIEGLRQPVTNSVLSYAGTRASLTAANALTGGAFGNDGTWGGVVKTGGHVTVFYDDQMYGAYGGAGLASLTGKNVTQNDQIDALLGTYFRPWKTDDWALRVGVSVYYTSFNRNLAGFTFGQGGYFSPQNYIALTFPVEYTGRADNWSWLAGAAVGVQHFNTSSSPIYPNNAFAQTALANIPGAQTAFSGSTETGAAFNLKGQIEYAIDNTFSVGASASLDNANNYIEGIGKIYLRKTFDWFAPVAAKNDPQSIVARDQPMSRL
jgi:cellulose synthase operon protein C